MDQKIKVLNVLTVVQDGGMETLVSRIYSGLDKNKFELYVCSLTSASENSIVNSFRKSDVNFNSLGFINKDIGITGIFRNIIEYCKLVFFIRSNKFDVVNAHDFFSAAVTRFALISDILLFYRPKLTYVTLHNIFFWLKPMHHFINRLLSIVTDKIICVSESVKSYSIENDKIKKEKYRVLYNAINEADFYSDVSLRAAKRNELGINENDFLIGNVGTFSIRKGQIYLLKAFHKIKGEFPNAKLLIVGGSRSHEYDIEREIISYIKKNELESSVILLETVKDINNLYNALDLFVMPSISEGFSLAALECMLTEKLCLFSDIGPFKELVNDSFDGFLFKNKDIDSLYEKLKFLIVNKDILQNIGQKARKSVLNRFNYEKMIKNYSDLYTTN